jgi:hypothetical protein
VGALLAHAEDLGDLDQAHRGHVYDAAWADHLTEGTIRAVPSGVFPSKEVG